MILTALALVAMKAQASDVEVPFRLLEDAIIVDISVNGHPVSCMFDTGFGGTVILNDSIDVGPVTGHETFTDFVGQIQVGTVKVKSLKIGAVSVDPTDKTVALQPMARMTSGYGVHCDGIMGLSAVKDMVTEINFQQHKFIFHPKSLDITKRTPDNSKSFLCKMLMTGVDSIQLTATASNGKKMILALDTGNEFYATTHKDVLERCGLWPEGRDAKFQTLSGVASGAVASWDFKMKDVTIFGVPVKESYWDIIDAPSSTAEADGTVGFGFLSNFNITFDFDRRRVWLENYSGRVANDSPGDLGISAGFDPSEKRVVIFHVEAESPADKAGIKAGDFLLSVGSQDLGEIDFMSLRKMLRGPVDSKVMIATSRDGNLNRQELARKQLINE